MECPKCRHKIHIDMTPEELIFCPYCEQRMVEPKSKDIRVCPTCNEPLPGGSSFCLGCGNDLDAPVIPLPLDSEPADHLEKPRDSASVVSEEPPPTPEPEAPAAPVREEIPPRMVVEALPVDREPDQLVPASACDEVAKMDIEETPFMRWEKENREKVQRETIPPVIETTSNPPSVTPEEIPQPVMEKSVRHEEPPPQVSQQAPPPHCAETASQSIPVLEEVPQPVREETHVVNASFCSACGQKLPPGSRFCLRCGQRITLLEGDTEAEQPQPAPPPPLEREIPVRHTAPSREDITELATPKATETATPPPTPIREDIRKLVNEVVAEPSSVPPYLESKPEPKPKPKPAPPLLPTMHVVPTRTPKAPRESLRLKIAAWISRTLQPLKDFVSGQWRLKRLYRKWTKDGVLAPGEIPSAEDLSQIAKESGPQPLEQNRLLFIILAGLVFVAFFVFIGITMSQCK